MVPQNWAEWFYQARVWEETDTRLQMCNISNVKYTLSASAGRSPVKQQQ